ncbi:MAG: VWA domain-containing protein [Lentisphaeria bacterium]
MIFRFAQPWFALLLPVVLAAAVLAWRRRPPAFLVSGTAAFAAAAAGRRTPWRWPLLLTVAGLGCGVVALMRPQAGVERLIERAEGVDIMLVLDVSGSMQSYDVPESLDNGPEIARAIRDGTLKTRLATAQEELRRFVEGRPNDRIGLIAFARLPYMACPPTLDHDFLLNHLATLEPGMLPDGTNIATPLGSATARLKDSPSRRRVAVLFTDGEHNVDASLSPRQAALLAKDNRVALHTVGIGSARAVILARDPFGNQGLQRSPAGLDQPLLEELAASTGGRYFAARDAAGFQKVMREIDALEKTSLEAPRYLDYREQFPGWLGAGLVLLLAGFLLEHTLLRTDP